VTVKLVSMLRELVMCWEEKLMRAQVQLYAVKQSYTRSKSVMRAHNQLCAVEQSYARSQPVMRGEVNLCALGTIYTRYNIFSTL